MPQPGGDESQPTHQAVDSPSAVGENVCAKEAAQQEERQEAHRRSIRYLYASEFIEIQSTPSHLAFSELILTCLSCFQVVLRTVVQAQSHQPSQQGAAKGKPAAEWGVLCQQLKPSLYVAEHMAKLRWLVRTRAFHRLHFLRASPNKPLSQHTQF